MTHLTQNRPAGRYARLDELRGLDLLSMIAYHGCWDAVFLFGLRAEWYTGWPGHLWQQSICWVFILLSGFCVPLGRHPLRRGARVFAAGALVTAVTLVFMPEDRVIFGVLTLLGSAMLLTGLLDPLLKKIPAGAGLGISAVLFALTYHTQEGFWGLGRARLFLPRTLYANLFTAFFGCFPDGFSPRIISRCCPGCFCSGQGIICTASCSAAWSRCAGRSVCRWAGWGGISCCSTCCISRCSTASCWRVLSWCGAEKFPGFPLTAGRNCGILMTVRKA